jgi:hypothetical protein
MGEVFAILGRPESAFSLVTHLGDRSRSVDGDKQTRCGSNQFHDTVQFMHQGLQDVLFQNRGWCGSGVSLQHLSRDGMHAAVEVQV